MQSIIQLVQPMLGCKSCLVCSQMHFLYYLYWDTRFCGLHTTSKKLYIAFYPGGDEDQLLFNIISYILALTLWVLYAAVVNLLSFTGCVGGG